MVTATGNEGAPQGINVRSIELAFFYLDLVARHALMADRETRRSLGDLKKGIWSDAGVDYTKLTTAGCDGDLLLWYLALLSRRHAPPVVKGWLDHPGPQSLLRLTGLSPRQFNALKKRLVKSAAQIEMINCRFDLGILLQTPHLKFFQPLPKLLRGYVSLLILASEKMGRGTHSYHNFAKGALIAHVHRSTRRYYDGPLSRLIAVVSGQRTSYGEVEHHNWRTQHADLIASLQS